MYSSKVSKGGTLGTRITAKRSIDISVIVTPGIKDSSGKIKCIGTFVIAPYKLELDLSCEVIEPITTPKLPQFKKFVRKETPTSYIFIGKGRLVNHKQQKKPYRQVCTVERAQNFLNNEIITAVHWCGLMFSKPSKKEDLLNLQVPEIKLS